MLFRSHEEYAEVARELDLCIIDSQAPNLQKGETDLRPQLARSSAFFSLAHYENSLDGLFDPTALSPNLRSLEKLVPRRGLVRDQRNRSSHMVEHALKFCEREMHVRDATSDIGLRIPPRIQQEPHASPKVVISPTSGKEKKNWLSQRFISLAAQLTERGVECVFAVAPEESAEWRLKLNGGFALAATDSVADLAELLAGASVVVSNDSGTAHLASAIGIQVVCIISSWDSSYGWRPGWAASELIRPLLPVRAIPGLWPHFVGVSRVFDAVMRRIEREKSDKN